MPRHLSLCSSLAATLALAAVTAGSAAPPPQESTEAPRVKADLVVSRDRLRSSVNLRYRKAEDGDCTLVEGCLGGTGKRRTLEFDTWVVNASQVDLVLGNPADRPDLYEYSPCHKHYHLKQSFVYAVAHGGADSGAVYDPASGVVLYRNAATSGAPDGTYALAPRAGALPLAGDWTADGRSAPGLYDPATGEFTLLTVSHNASPVVFTYTPETGTLLPVAGDWDGDGTDTVGLYSPSSNTFYLKTKNSKNKKALTVHVEPGPGDWVPVAGDWEGRDVDSVGLYDRSTGTFALWNAGASGAPSATFAFGGPGLTPVAGDWNRDGIDTVGVFDPATGEFRVREENGEGEPDATFTIDAGGAAGLVPLAGDWDYETGDVLVPGHKEAFCWLDTQRFSGDRSMQFVDCNVKQGLTAGWSDVYIRNTDCQWIDITGLAPGVYQLTVTVNAAGVIPEQDTTNNSASVKVRVPAASKTAKAPEVTVASPEGGRTFKAGEPVKIRWSVKGNVTHQEIWLADVHDDHPSKVLLIDGNVDRKRRSYTWVPTSDFASPAAQIVVRAQDDRNFVGTDRRSRGKIAIEPR